MRRHFSLICALILTSSAIFAQTKPPEQAIVVGRLSNLRVTGSASAFQATAQLKIERPVTGPLNAGAAIALNWEFKPIQRQDAESIMNTPLFGLFRLEKGADGRWLPRLAGLRSPGTLGGIVLPLADAPLSLEFNTAPGAPPGLRVAAELAAWMTAWVPNLGEPPLTAVRLSEAHGGWSQDRQWAASYFGYVISWFQSLDVSEAEPIYRQLLRSPSPALRASAVAALLRTGDREALSLLESQPKILAAAPLSWGFGPALNHIPRDRLPALVPVIGRIALGETEFSGHFESEAILVLGHSRERAAIPYLAAFLESPYNEKRVRAVVSLCYLLQSLPGEKAQFRPSPRELYAHCPNGVPLRKPSTEPVYTTYWRAWYASIKDPLLQELKLADVRTPSRFRDTSIADEYEPELPLEARFNAYISTVLRGVAERDSVPAGSPPKLVFAGRMKLSDEDKVIAIVTGVNTQLTQLKQELMQPYKATGVFPSQAAIDRAEDSRRTVLKSGLESLRRELTPEGYKLFEGLLLEMGLSISPPTSLGPWD